jgi:serine/threonine protein kinase
MNYKDFKYLSEGIHGCTFINKNTQKIIKIIGVGEYLQINNLIHEIDINQYLSEYNKQNPNLKISDHFCLIESIREINNNEVLSHPLIKLCNIKFTDKIYEIIMPYCGIPLVSYLLNNNDHYYKRNIIISKLIKSLSLLHKIGFTHGDLHANNILVDDSEPLDIKVRIIDFSYANKITFLNNLELLDGRYFDIIRVAMLVAYFNVNIEFFEVFKENGISVKKYEFIHRIKLLVYLIIFFYLIYKICEILYSYLLNINKKPHGTIKHI